MTQHRKVAVLYSGSSYNVKFSLPTQLKNLVEPNDADVFVFTTKLCKRRKTEHTGEIPDASENDKWNEKASKTLLDEHNLRQSEIDLIKETFGERLKGFAIAEDDTAYMEYLAQERENMMDIINRYIDESNYLKLPAPFRGTKLTGANNPQSNGTIRCVVDQYRHIKKCYEMMEQYERENNFKYEWVMRVRIDFIVPFELNIEHYSLNHDTPFLYVAGSFRQEVMSWMDEFFWFSRRSIAEKLYPNLSMMGMIKNRKHNTIQYGTAYAGDAGNDLNFDPEIQFSLLLYELKIDNLINVRIFRSAMYSDGEDGYDYFNYVFQRATIDLEHEFFLVKNCETDINFHTTKLREYGEKCDTIIELGLRYGNSTTAFLASRPNKFVSYDLQYNAKMDYLKLIASDNDIDFEIRIENPTPEEEGGVSKLPFDPDFLFIDTNHYAQQMALELKLHAPRVKKYIGMHDVFVFWNRGAGDDHLPDGLKHAVEPFLESHKDEWRVAYRTDENNGLMILERINQLRL